MHPMKRDVIERILGKMPGIEAAKERYAVGEDHHLSLYLGDPGRAMIVGEIDRVVLEEEFAEVSTRDAGTIIFVTYDAIQAIAIRPPKENRGRRAGFA